jgi:hypothetical protein
MLLELRVDKGFEGFLEWEVEERLGSLELKRLEGKTNRRSLEKNLI